MSTSIRIENASLHYSGQRIFNNLNCEIPGAHTTCLLGPSGVGKTSLLRNIAGLLTPSEASHVTGTFKTDNQKPLRDQISYMAQNDTSMPWLTAKENVMLGATLRRNVRAKDTERALALLNRVGLGSVAEKYPHELSGGMRSRLGLARTLFESKPIILLDEPFASVDAITKIELQTLLCETLKGKTVLLVTHDPLEALRIGDFVYLMSGSPATCEEAIQLADPTPRNPSDDKLLKLHAVLIEKLTQAKALGDA